MKDPLSSLDTPGGHILVCLFLLILGAGFWSLHVAKSDDIMIFALGALGRSMLGLGTSDPSK